jgi:hypothetical protein
MTQLTEHFSLEELTRSDYATLHNINNTPTDIRIIGNLEALAELMERIRKLLGDPISVSSGYRCPKVNTAIGGSKTSAHLQGMACDFNAVGYDAKGAALKIAPLVKEFGIDQLIYEVRDNTEWVHVGMADDPRGQILTAIFEGGKARYVGGII